jgi:hypothetical protein
VIRFFVLPALIVSIFATNALADISNYAPDKRVIGRGELTSICLSMGDTGKGFNLGGTTGDYGCQNQDNGAAVTCSGDGQCTDHVGDPRWRRIKELIDNAGKKQQRHVPL